MAFLQTILLQANQEATKVAELSLFELLKEGGLLMIPIAICSIIMCVVFIERFLYIKALAKLDPNFSNKIKEQLENDNKAGAISICKNKVCRLLCSSCVKLCKVV